MTHTLKPPPARFRMSDFHDSSDDEPKSPSLRKGRCASPCKRQTHAHPGGPLTLDKKWQEIMDGKEDLSEFTHEDMRRGIAVLLRRVCKYEEDARADRARFFHLHTEHLNLKAKVEAMDAAWKTAIKDLAKLPEVPSYADLMSDHAATPRTMTQFEIWNMNHALLKLKDGGKVALEVTKIMDVQPVNGHVRWNFAGLPARTQWQVYYHLMFRGVKKKKVLTARTQQGQAEINAAGPVTSSSFEGLTLRSEEEYSEFCEQDDSELEEEGVGVPVS